MNMHETETRGESLHEIAARWHVLLRENGEAGAHATAFSAWLDADIAHRLAYAEVCAAAFASEQILDASAHAETAAVHDATGFGGPPRLLRQRPTIVTRRRRRLAVLAALAASLLALLMAPGLILQWRADFIGTPGTVARHALADGSVLSLDGASAVRIRFDDKVRRVELLRGAVHVDVETDASRPFVVAYADLAARALGTRFSVAEAGQGKRVSVEEGLVEVRVGDGAPVRLHGGQAVAVAEDGTIGAARPVESLDGGWVEGQLVFSATPFDAAVEAMARHLPERVWIARRHDPPPVTAVAPLADAAALLDRLARERGFSRTRIPGFIIVLH